MIRSLRLINFKPFENQTLEFKPLTLLSGLNSSGKSSVLQALLLLRQSYQQELLPNVGLALNGDLVRIGTAQDALFEGAKEDVISFKIVWDNSQEGFWHFNYNREGDVLNLASSSVLTEVYQSSLFSKNFHYLQAERIGPRAFLEMSDFQVQQLKQIGSKGEYTAHFLAMNQSKTILNSKLSHPHVKQAKSQLYDQPAFPSMNLLDQIEAWMGEISPGTQFKIIPKPDVDLISIQYFYGDSNSRRATNVGFGISYTLPIIAAVLASEPGTLILIENPEAHLHPKGQSRIGRLLALAASCGIQVVLETHSDHVLNGIRLAVHSGEVNSNDICLHFFQRFEEQRQIKTEVISPKMDQDGRINQWPDGFFDQMEIDLMELI